MVPPPAARTRSSSAGSGSRSAESSWAPQRSAASHGPSRWMPATRPDRTCSAIARTWASSSAGWAVTSEAIIVVVPCRRCRSTAVAVAASISDGSAAGNAPPPPPCTCMSTNPGTTVTAPNSRSAGRGGSPAPTARTTSPVDVDPSRPQQLATGDDGIGGDQHAGFLGLGGRSDVGERRSDALPGRLGLVGLPVVVGQLQPARGRAVQQHRRRADGAAGWSPATAR